MHIGEAIRRRAFRRAIVPLLRAGVRVLDAGCGRGDSALWLAQRYPDIRVDAVDIDPKLVEFVQRRISDLRARNVQVRAGDIETFAVEGEKRDYGIIYSVDVFEHLRDPAAAFRGIIRATAPGGVILIHVPSARQRRWFRRFERYEQHDHERDGFEPEELAALLRDAGLESIAIRHTFGPPGSLAWELFHLAQRIGKWLALLTYPVPWALAWLDGLFDWRRGNGFLIIAQKT